MKYVIANWKQNKTLGDAINWCGDFVRLLGDIDLNKVVSIVCPPMPFLEKMGSVLQPHGVYLGVQDISPFVDGVHTGFIGTNQVKQFCKYAVVGHSERQEPRDLVMQKAERCVDTDIVPIVCFKSTDEYKIIDRAIYVLEDPQNISVDGIYRPKNLQDIVNLVDEARKFFGPESIIIYGGSVNRENSKELALIRNLDGVLVGNAGLNPSEFADIVRKFST